MRAFFLVASVLAALVVTAGVANAQSAGPQLDVAGVKLGVTIADAEAALRQFDPKLQFVPLFATDNRDDLDGWNLGSAWGLSAIDDTASRAALRNAKLKVQIGVFAAEVREAFADDGSTVADPAKPIADLSGEFFHLFFRPGDDGARLYAVDRFSAYSADGTDTPIHASLGAPTPVGLQSQLLAKFGKPSGNKIGGDTWLYDWTGRQLSEGSKEYFRCHIWSANDAGGVVYRRTMSIQKTVGGQLDATATESDLRTFGLVMSDADGAALSPDDQANASMLSSNLRNIVTNGAGENQQQYRQCGVELEVTVEESHDQKRVLGFAEYLSDLNALNFDNGIAGYLKHKLGLDTATPAAPAKL